MGKVFWRGIRLESLFMISLAWLVVVGLDPDGGFGHGVVVEVVT